LPVLLPPLDEQRRIASILGTYDDLIEVNRQRVAVLEAMARGLFEEWFVRFRFPGHENHKIIDTPDGPLPEGWEWTPLEALCSRITDGSHFSPPSVTDGAMMASVRDMREWGFDFSDCRRISNEDFETLVKSDCRPLIGDILIAKDGANLNKHTFYVWRDEPVVLLSSIAIIRPKVGTESQYLVAFLKSDGASATIKNMKSGAAIPRIVLKDFRRLLVLWPSQDIRSRFDSMVAPLHAVCRTLVDINAKLATSRDLLLPRLISGELSISAAEAELEAAA
jgi:type I restriction enzyme S subunit